MGLEQNQNRDKIINIILTVQEKNEKKSFFTSNAAKKISENY